MNLPTQVPASEYLQLAKGIVQRSCIHSAGVTNRLKLFLEFQPSIRLFPFPFDVYDLQRELRWRAEEESCPVLSKLAAEIADELEERRR